MKEYAMTLVAPQKVNLFQAGDLFQGAVSHICNFIHYLVIMQLMRVTPHPSVLQ